MTDGRPPAARRGPGRARPGSAPLPPALLAEGAGSVINGLMAGTDWAASALGPVRDSPAQLRTAANICLNSPFPMLIMWGPRLAMVYNDAFVPILGDKHPALGLPCPQVWADAWPVVGGWITGVMEQGEATYHEDLLLILQRRGFDEEVYFTFAYSAIPLAAGGVGGVFTVVTETTGQVLGTRRMQALQEVSASRSAQAASARDACAAAMLALGSHRADLPFGIVYLLDDAASAATAADAETTKTALAVASFGLTDRNRLPEELLEGDSGDWIRASIATGATDVRTGMAASAAGHVLPGATAAGDADADTMVALPLTVAGQPGARGALVVGVSPYLRLDPDYLGFLELVARQVAAGVTDAEAHAAQRRRAEDLAALDRAKTEFFTGVSHELRTPLALIAGPARDALADTADPLPPAQRRRLEIIDRNGGRLRRMVDTLLDFARIEDGRLQAEPVPLDLGDLTRGVAESFAPAVERAGLAFAVDCPPTGFPVPADPEMWEKIVLNLLSNAVKFTLDGSIRISLRAAGKQVELTVADTGVGIAEDQLPRLFERFYQVRGLPGRSHEGSGIGLALVRELAALHGGAAEASSRVGEGSTFTVRIPARRGRGRTRPAAPARPEIAGRYVDEALQWSAAAPEPPATADAARPAETGAQPGRPPRPTRPGHAERDKVLIAEDNADMRRYLTDLLEPGYQVAAAATGAQALAYAALVRPDLVLADVMMPGLDGFGLLAALRADPATAQVPVLLLSARAGEEATIEGLAAGADDYLAKPFSSAELLARVRSNLDLARVRNRESAWRSTLTKAMQDGLFVATADGTVVEVNDAFTALLGFPADELPWPVPHPWWPREDEDPEAYAQVNAAIGAIRTGGGGRYTLPLRRRDGRTLWVDVAIAGMRDRDREMLVGTLRDVTVEHVAAERDSALARLAGQLTGIDDSARLLDVALAELRALWQARSASIVTWDEDGRPRRTSVTPGVAGPDGTPGAAEPDPGSGLGTDPALAALLPPADAQDRARAGLIITAPADQAPDAALTGVGAPISDGVRTALVWLEFSPARQFRAADRTLLDSLGGHLQRAFSRARAYEEQRQVALALQRAILGPTDLPAGFAVRYEPASAALEVGGDWYDVVELPGDRYAVVVGDVVGRGLPAATVMGQLRSAGRALLLENHGPGRVLFALNRFSTLIPGAFCTTVFCAVVDRSAGTLRYSSAGHVPALLAAPDGTVRLLGAAQSPPLAVAAALNRPEATADLPAGSTLLLYTDGLVERRGEVLDTGIQRAVDALRESRGLPPEGVADFLSARLLDSDQNDDVALLVYRQPEAAATADPDDCQT